MDPQGQSQNLDREILYNLQKILQHLIAFETSFNEHRAWCATESAALRWELSNYNIQINASIWNVKTAIDQEKAVLTILKSEIETDIANDTEYHRQVLDRMNTHYWTQP